MNIRILFSSSVCLRNSMTPNILPSRSYRCCCLVSKAVLVKPILKTCKRNILSWIFVGQALAQVLCWQTNMKLIKSAG